MDSIHSRCLLSLSGDLFSKQVEKGKNIIGSRKLVHFMILDPDCRLQKKRSGTGKTIKQRAVTCTVDTINISKSPPFSILLFVIIWTIMMRGVRYDATINVLVWHLHEPKSNQHLTYNCKTNNELTAFN